MATTLNKTGVTNCVISEIQTSDGVCVLELKKRFENYGNIPVAPVVRNYKSRDTVNTTSVLKSNETSNSVGLVREPGETQLISPGQDSLEKLACSNSNELDYCGNVDTHDETQKRVDKEDDCDQTYSALPTSKGSTNKKSSKTKTRSRKDKQKKVEAEDGVIERVELKTKRSPLALPKLPDHSSQNMIKRHCMLQSLTNSELQYMASLESIKKHYKEFILSETKDIDVKVMLEKAEDMIEIHKMFHIALAEKLEKWNTDESIGIIFNVFSQPQFVDVYSAFVNSYNAAVKTLCELETKPNFKEFLKSQQKKSKDMMPLHGLLLKPIQRFPQFIMIIKDLLKYTPIDHHDREPLQEAITWIENVAHQLDERKLNSEQRFLGQQIMRKMKGDHKMNKFIKSNTNIFLIRQDDMELDKQDPSASNNANARRLFLMNNCLIMAQVCYSDDSRLQGCKYKWYQHLSDLELTASTKSPSKRYHNTDLAEMLHDNDVLVQINHLVSTLKRSYQGLSVDLIPSIQTQLLTQIQSKGYHQHVINSSTITLDNRRRKKKYLLNASDAITKQEWCIDFLMAKLALDTFKKPSWHPCQTDGVVQPQPCLFLTYLRVDVQRTNTKIQCAVKVFVSLNNDDSVEQLWLCSSNKSQGQVSVVSLDLDKPSLRESFQAVNSEIICMETVPGYTCLSCKGDFENDSVWIVTVDSEIHVFMLNGNKSHSPRGAAHVFQPSCVIVTIKHAGDHVFCGSRCGSVVVYHRDTDGLWSEFTKINLGSDAVTSLVCVGNSMWVACGSDIHIIDIDTCKSTGKVHHQLIVMNGQLRHFQHLVKSGVGIWASFAKQPNICLYNSETKRLIQDVNICSAINNFISACSGNKENTMNYEVTCLMASLGFLWVGTNIGITLKYPLPRVKEGIPRINQHPQVAFHGHCGPVKFLVPLHCGTSLHRQKSSNMSTNFIDKTIIKALPNESKRCGPNEYMTLNDKVSQQTADAVDDSSISTRETCFDVTSKIYDVIPKVALVEDRKMYADQDERLVFSQDGETTDSDLHVIESQIPEDMTISADLDELMVQNENGDITESDLHVIQPLIPVNAKQTTVAAPLHFKQVENKINEFKHETLKTNIDSENGPVEDVSKTRNEANVCLERKDEMQQQRSLQDSDDSDGTADVLYHSLECAQRHGSALGANKDIYFNTLSKRSYTGVHCESTEKTPAMNIPVGKPDLSSSMQMYSKDEKYVSSSPSSFSSPLSPPIQFAAEEVAVRSASFEENTENKQNGLPCSRTSVFRGSSADTLTKQESNTVIVVTGGDGYMYRKTRDDYRLDEPCLVFWMYKL